MSLVSPIPFSLVLKWELKSRKIHPQMCMQSVWVFLNLEHEMR